MPSRRLPVYLLCDCSGSMKGEPIQAVQAGIESLVSALLGDPTTFGVAHLSVITFSNQASQIVPLTPALDFQARMPQLQTQDSATFLGLALELLEQCLDRDLQKKDATQQGDYLPLIFILTDGKPSDVARFRGMADRIWSGAVPAIRPDRVIACAAGPKADPAPLRELTDNVLVLANLTPEGIAKYFELASIVTSNSIGYGQAPGDSLLHQAMYLGLYPSEGQ